MDFVPYDFNKEEFTDKVNDVISEISKVDISGVDEVIKDLENVKKGLKDV